MGILVKKREGFSYDITKQKSKSILSIKAETSDEMHGKKSFFGLSLLPGPVAHNLKVKLAFLHFAGFFLQ